MLFRSVQGYSLLNGVMVTPAMVHGNNNMKEEESIDLGQWLSNSPPALSTSSTIQQRTLLIFGTYAADFNMIE